MPDTDTTPAAPSETPTGETPVADDAPPARGKRGQAKPQRQMSDDDLLAAKRKAAGRFTAALVAMLRERHNVEIPSEAHASIVEFLLTPPAVR